MRSYFGRKLVIYALTFFLAVTIDWMIPRFMPGNPVQVMLARYGLRADAAQAMLSYYTQAFGLDLPVWQQYLNFWKALFHGDLGISMYLFPTPVIDVIKNAVPYDILLLLPAILLSWFAGNRFGAFAARSKILDNSVLPVGYLLTATPYMWLALLLGWALGIVLGIFPSPALTIFRCARPSPGASSPVCSRTGSCRSPRSFWCSLGAGRSVCAT